MLRGFRKKKRNKLATANTPLRTGQNSSIANPSPGLHESLGTTFSNSQPQTMYTA